MPTYDYQCSGCEHEFELFQSISDRPRRKCPACGEMKLKRLIGPGAAVVFKGSGFYQTDYRSESYRKRAAEEKSATSGTTEAKSDTSAATDGSGKKRKPKPPAASSKN
ncbi:MAG: zinc ribbon domain-containing protein [Pirellulaceae bacterium]|jgi:putative FmdB family regulatory protein|nr:zinc ribbon domain-containing protein [Pirellulaceae bacterium]